MAVATTDLLAMLNDELQPERFQDYCPNGLQVAGRDEVSLLVTGVTACQALLDEAVALGADAILVHHGYFWKGEGAEITGMKYRRIKTLINNGINLIAYHLPLDAHPTMGNNATLAAKLGLRITGTMPGSDPAIGFIGELSAEVAGSGFAAHIEKTLGRAPLHVDADRPLRRLAFCTGGAQGFIEEALELDVDGYLTGEVSEQTVHVAREHGRHFFAAGHHATESFGVQAVGGWLAERTGVRHQHVDIANPA